jgi:hypothetical protein
MARREGTMTEHDAHVDKDFSLTEPVSAPEGDAVPQKLKADADTLGESSGGFLGAVAGMSVGAVAGPVGLVLGGLAGALGGWWAGRGISEAITDYDDEDLRRHYAESPHHLADRSYADVSAAYVAGHLAGRNPEYAGRSFEQIEPDLRRGWSDEVATQVGEWSTVRSFALTAFERARGATPTR